MNYRDQVKQKLKDFDEYDIIISSHALIRIRQRQIGQHEILENILNPQRLEYAILENSSDEGERFDCYFIYSKTLCHRYVMVIKDSVIVVTAIKIHRKWQSIVERKLRSWAI